MIDKFIGAIIMNATKITPYHFIYSCTLVLVNMRYCMYYIYIIYCKYKYIVLYIIHVCILQTVTDLIEMTTLELHSSACQRYQHQEKMVGRMGCPVETTPA